MVRKLYGKRGGRGGGDEKAFQKAASVGVGILISLVLLNIMVGSDGAVLVNSGTKIDEERHLLIREESSTSMTRGGNQPNVLALKVPSQSVPAKYSTPPCQPHTQVCDGICHQVTSFVQQQRNFHLTNPKKSWLKYYGSVNDYYRCIKAKKIVEVGIAFGSQTAYHLKQDSIDPFLEEYHTVDPFMAGYDPNDGMSAEFQKAAPGSKPEDISVAWFQGISKDLGVDGSYLSTTTDDNFTPAACKLRMHSVPSDEGAKLFGDTSVDVVFIDGLHTYEGVVVDIQAWMSKIRVGGSLIFNSYQALEIFPGVSKAVKEEAARQNIEVLMLADGVNALLGGKKECATGRVPF